MTWLLLVFIAIGVGSVLVLVYLSALRRSSYDLNWVTRHRSRQTTPVVIATGDSITAATMSGDYVGKLRARLCGDYHVVNAGINGETSAGLLKRIDQLVACDPAVVTILVGTNDALFSLVPAIRRWNVPLGSTGTSAYRSNLARIVETLRTSTRARIALLSPPPLGEDLDGEINSKLLDYVAVVRTVADLHGLTYLPLYEQLSRVIRSSPRPPPAFKLSLQLSLGAAIKHYVLRRDWNSISDDAGFTVLIDNIHLNDRGAEVAARLIASFVAAGPRP